MVQRTVFVSYSRKDSTRVQQAVALLEAGGAEVFRDVDDIRFGDRWEDVIKDKLAEAERVLVFWSQNAQTSEWVGREWAIALEMGKRLVPVLLDRTPLPPALGQFHALTNFLPPPASSWRYAAWAGGSVLGVLLTVVVLLSRPHLSQQDDFRSVPLGEQPSGLVVQQSPEPPVLPDAAGEPPATDSSGSASAPTGGQPVAPIHPPKATAPEPQMQDNTPVFWFILAGMAVLAAGYGLWRRRSRAHGTQALAEQLVKQVFEEH